MKCSYIPKTIRLEHRAAGSAARLAGAAKQVRYAEELAEIETTVSRAALLMRRGVKKAA